MNLILPLKRVKYTNNEVLKIQTDMIYFIPEVTYWLLTPNSESV